MTNKTEYYREYRRKKEGKPDYQPEDMVECLTCHRTFVLLGTHVVQTHKDLFSSMLEYKKHFGMDTKRGRTRGQFKELKSKAVTKKSIENLKEGRKFWFKKGDKKAGRYIRSAETKERLRKQGKGMGDQYGGKVTLDNVNIK